MRNECTCHVYGQIHKWDPKNWSNDARNPIKQNKTGKIFRGGSAKRNRGPWNPRYKYFNLSNLTKNQGVHSRQGESSTAPLNTPVQGEPLTTRSATPAVGTHPHYLREGLEPKGYGLNCHLSWMFVCTKRRLLAQKHSSCMPMYCKHMGNCKTIKPMQLMRLEEWLTGHNSERGLPM